MNRFWKTIIAFFAARRYGGRVLGGGCLGAIVVFIIVYWLLGMVAC
ncbi:MAG: hypothetical protein J5I50_11780 [Chitinophagaceae bacterium]|nr:hypothetical protein [Chitinophagaceae bacterium]